MRTVILTENDREIINAYLQKKLKLEGFRLLKHRANKSIQALEKDLELLKRFVRETK